MKRFSSLVISLAVVAAVIGSAVLAAQPANARTSLASSHPFVDIAILLPGAPINWYNNQPLQWELVDTMELGIVKIGASSPFAFFPGLAKSWQIQNHARKVTVHLQPNARWSDGKPVTAHDLIVTAEIGFVRGTAGGFFLKSVKALNSKTVVYTDAPEPGGKYYNLFPRAVLEQDITPSETFAKLLPSNISTLIKQSQYSGTDPALLAQQKDVLNQFAGLAKKIEAYAPSKDISSGPYVIKSYNPGEAILVKNPHFYNASKIKISQLTFRNYNGDNNTIWNYILGGQVYQATSGGMTTALVNRMKRVPHNIYYQVPSTASAQLIFNEADYPYGITKVRQALAYVINRQQVTKVGEPVSGTYNHWPSATVDANTKSFLTKAQLRKLNPYNPSRARAASLLKSAHFTQRGGKWYTPKGQQFAITLTTVNGFNDWVTASQQVQSQLNSFGISTTTNVESSYAQYLKDLAAQKVPFGFWIGVGTTPYAIASRLYGTGDGYQVQGGKLIYFPASVHEQGNWLDFPQTVKVKGYGSLNVGKLTYQLSTATSQAKIKKIMQQLIVATNQYVPEITLWNYETVGFVNDKYFTDFPLKNKVVQRACVGESPPIGCWTILGYVKPR